MKVTIDIPESKLRAFCAILNMEKDCLTDEIIDDIVHTPEVDVTELLLREDGSKEIFMVLGMFALGEVIKQKYPDL